VTSPVLDPMPPAHRENRMMLLVFGTGAAIGIHLSLLHLIFLRSPLAVVPLVSSLVYACAIYALWRWVFPRLGGRTLGAQLLREGLVSFVALGLLSLVAVEAFIVISGFPSLLGPAVGVERHIVVTPEMRQRGARLFIFLPIVPTILLTLVGYHQYWWRVLTLQNRERHLTELAATAQLAALRAQINPHFLFNSLNSIAQLIHTDPDKAEVCVERLAEIFRYILGRAEKDLVPLAEELHMAEAYLDIERMRFGERLQVDIRVDKRSLAQPIPNLILQPLVENAIKHGLSLKMGTGTVRIEAAIVGGTLCLSVRDDGLGMAAPALAEVWERGVGLRNLRDRLRRLYGEAYLPEISSAPGGGTEVRLSLPLGAAEVAA
jgi:signal transduction histidine kinase